MIIKLQEIPANIQNLNALDERANRYREFNKIDSQILNSEPIKIEFVKILKALPFLFLAGIFTGIAMMLAF